MQLALGTPITRSCLSICVRCLLGAHTYLDEQARNLFAHQMNVSAIFQHQYDGELSGAVWIMDTTSNRVCFEGTTDLDPNSALFSTESYATLQSALCGIIWSIQDHYPDLETISVIGVDLDTSMTRILQDGYETETTSNGFICRRTYGG